MAKRLPAVFLALLLWACSSPTPTTPPPPPVKIITTPVFEGVVAGWISDFNDQSSYPLLNLEVTAPIRAIESLQFTNADLIVSGLEPPSGWFATPLFLEPIAIVVNPSNPLRSIASSQLQALFSGKLQSWDELEGPDQAVQPILPLQGDEIRSFIERKVLIEQSPSPNTLLAPTVLAMAEIVSSEPGAIGVLPSSQLTEGVRVLQLDGVRPNLTAVADEHYPLYLEILAIAPEEPSGPARAWLEWMQNQ